MGPRVPRRPTSGLGRRLLGGSCAPSRRPAALFPRGCSGFRRLRPLPPSCCLAASPRLPCRPGAAPRCAGAPPARCGLLSVSAAAAGPAVVSCADGGRLLPPYAVRPPPPAPARVPGRGSGPGCPPWPLRPRAASAGGGGCRVPARLPLAPRERAPARPGPGVADRSPGPARAPPPGAGPVCWRGRIVPRLSAPPPVCPRPWWRGPASQPRSPLRVGLGRGEWGSVFPLPPPRAPALRVGGCRRRRRRHRRVCLPALGTSGPPGDLAPAPLLGGAGCLWLTALLPG